jgi:hypothetical protein
MTAGDPMTARAVLTPVRLAGGAGDRSVIDESDNTLVIQRFTIYMRVDGEIWQRISADRVQDPVGIFRDDLDMIIKEHPVAGLRLVSIAQRVPAVMVLGVLADGDNAGGGRILVDARIGPLMQRPRVRRAAGHPALLANGLRR